MYHLFDEWGIPIVLCNPDGSIISPDEPTGSVLARLKIVEDKESYVKVHYHVLQPQLDEKLSAKLRFGAHTAPPSVPACNEAVNEQQQPIIALELEYAGEIPQELEAIQDPVPEVLPNATHPAELTTVDVTNLPLPFPPPPIPLQLADRFDLSLDMARKIHRGWSLTMTKEGQVNVLPPPPPPLPPRRTSNSHRTPLIPPQLPDRFGPLLDMAQKIHRGWSLTMTKEGQVNVLPPLPPPLPPR